MKLAVVPATCEKTFNKFSIYLEERTPGVVTAARTFEIQKGSYMDEKRDLRMNMSGRYEIAPEYACPYCKGKTFVLCTCGGTSCFDWTDGRGSHTCPHCKTSSIPNHGLNSMNCLPSG